MLVSEQWLREFVSPDKTSQEIADQLTMAGLEVDAVESCKAQFSGVVIARIDEIEQHPDAEKLRICQVFDGQETTQVVCGAPNARQGLIVAFAKVGAKLPELKIKKAKLRGVESFGMLCGETELSLGDDDSGLMELHPEAPLGVALDEFLKLDDTIIEVDLTPNRADCFNMLGVARDLAAINSLPFTEPQVVATAAVHQETVGINRVAAEACPRYIGRVINGVDASKPSPSWMQEKLRRAGLRSIDAIVDVTNYVLLELGQPMHAFDKDKLDGDIIVRMAEQDEEIALLNGQSATLNSDTLIIADNSKALAIAGIMGGDESAVSSATQNIVLESAFFDPVVIAGKARSYGLHTDSSMRFERGVDFLNQERAIERATELLLDIVGGEAGPVIVSQSQDLLPSLKPIQLRRERIGIVTGLSIEDAKVVSIFEGLGCNVEEQSGGWLLTPPSWRFDFAIEADLIEELARLIGYNNLPTSLPVVAAELPLKPESQTPLNRFKQSLATMGYQEVITYSFISPELHQTFFADKAVHVQNPISADMASMRTSLVPGLVATAIYNINRQEKNLKLFETGLTFIPSDNGLPNQETVIAGLITGNRAPENWHASDEPVDFFDIKGDVENLLPQLQPLLRYEKTEVTWLHPGQSAALMMGEDCVGVIGAIHPEVAKKAGLSQNTYVFELQFAAIREKALPVFSEVSRFPEVRRDIAVIVDEAVTAETLEHIIRAKAGEYFKKFTIFDIYQGKGIELHRKSVAIGLTFQSKAATLTDETINPIVESVVQSLAEELNATLRS